NRVEIAWRRHLGSLIMHSSSGAARAPRRPSSRSIATGDRAGRKNDTSGRLRSFGPIELWLT
ncbi:MAG: hypothetical protein ACR2OO_10935, partial [Thermomicrobiales bacterium]